MNRYTNKLKLDEDFTLISPIIRIDGRVSDAAVTCRGGGVLIHHNGDGLF